MSDEDDEEETEQPKTMGGAATTRVRTVEYCPGAPPPARGTLLRVRRLTACRRGAQ